VKGKNKGNTKMCITDIEKRIEDALRSIYEMDDEDAIDSLSGEILVAIDKYTLHHKNEPPKPRRPEVYARFIPNRGDPNKARYFKCLKQKSGMGDYECGAKISFNAPEALLCAIDDLREKQNKTFILWMNEALYEKYERERDGK
jgi:hypothetical protein